MSAIYDNWERLVAAVLKKEQLWQLFHEQSRSTSISSASSDFSFSRLNSSLGDVPFSFSSPEWAASNHKNDGFNSKTDAATRSAILVNDQSPVDNFSSNENVNFTPPRKRDLRIEVPKLQIQHRGFSPRKMNLKLSSRGNRDDTEQVSYPLPLPPAATSDSSHRNAAAKSPSPPLHSAERAKDIKTSWKKGKFLGRGPLGGVYLGFNSEKGQMCAMKEVSLSSKDAGSKHNARMLEKEIAVLSHINHPNIVRYYGSEMVADKFYIYFEYLSGGSIYMILQQYGRLGESAIRIYIQQVLSGLAYLHSMNIAHRDIRGANILLDPNGRAKLTNFGIEKHIAEQFRMSWFMDNPYWMAPEVIVNPNVRNLAVDIWSLGCTVLEMATSRPPLSQYDRGAAMFKIANHKELPTFPDHLSDVCIDFLRRCLQWNPLHRATAAQLLEHRFVKNSSPVGKQILVSTSSGHPAVTNAVKSEGNDHARSPHQLDKGKVAFSFSRASKSNFQPRSSDIYTPRNTSAPVSPVGSPLPLPRSPQHLNRQMSPPPKSTSSPIIGGIGAIKHPHLNQSMLQQETFHYRPKQSPNINSPSYWDPNILRGLFRFS